MKKFLLSSVFLTISLISLAQIDLKQEIISFSDTTELIIRNGRKMLVEKTVKGDHEGSNQLLNYLKSNVDNRYVILYPYEEILISLANRNFRLFLFNAKNFSTLMEGKTKTVQTEPIQQEINAYLSKEIDYVKADVETSALNEEEKSLIRLFIRYYFNDNSTDLYKDIKNFKKTYPRTEYADFANQMKGSSSSGRMNFSLGYGHEFINGNISDYFDNHFQIMSFEIDGFVNRTYWSLFFSGSVGSFNSTIDIPVRKNDLIHKAGESASTIKYGLKLGHSVYSNKSINFYPYFALGGYEIMSQSDDFEDFESSEEKNSLSVSFFNGVGASCDVFLKKWKSKNSYGPDGYVFIRPGAEFDYFFTNKEISKGSAFSAYITLGIGFGDTE